MQINELICQCSVTHVIGKRILKLIINAVYTKISFQSRLNETPFIPNIVLFVNFTQFSLEVRVYKIKYYYRIISVDAR